jgi:acetyl esterase/lipase
LPPRHPHPAAVDDCLAVYRALLEVRDPADVVVGGASAGGNLAAALLLRARNEGLPMPAALVLATPLVDCPSPATPSTPLTACTTCVASCR